VSENTIVMDYLKRIGCPKCGRLHLRRSGPTEGKRPMAILHTVTCLNCGHQFERVVKQCWATSTDPVIDYRIKEAED
jgi:transcription elongation factor Elf1